jgi:hypothetical protein
MNLSNNISTDGFFDNKYLIGAIMIIVNFGARFIVNELDDNQKKLINTKILRRVLIFCIIFLATRDLTITIILSVIIIFVVFELFNESSEYSLFPKKPVNENENENEKEKIDKNQKIDLIIEELKTI